MLGKWSSQVENPTGASSRWRPGYRQDGTLVCVFRTHARSPAEAYVKEHGGEQPGRPEPAPESS